MLKKLFCFCAAFMFTIHLVAQEVMQEDSVRVATLNELIISNKYYKRYNLTKLSSDLRLQSPLLETPQNIQIISSEVLKDQVVYNITESVTRNVSGTMREELHNGVSPDIYSRGGYINAQRNGVDLRPLIKGPLGDDAAIIESIEFIKGPSGFLTGMSDPAGSYNVITKKPNGLKRNTVKLMYGSFDFFRGEADLSGVLDTAGKWQYRFNMMAMNTKGFMKFDNNERMLLAPAITYKLSPKTSFTLEYIYQRLNYMLLSEAQVSPYGYGTLPRDFSISDPNIRPYRANDHNLFFTTEHKFNDAWNFTARVSNINNGYNGNIFWIYGKNHANPDILNRYYVYDGMEYNVFSTQVYIQGRFATGKIKHALLAGIDFNHKINNTVDTWETATSVYPLSISQPEYSNVINNNGFGGDFHTENTITGVNNLSRSTIHYSSVHVMDEISLSSKLKVNAGLRLTKSNANANQYGAGSSAEDFVLTPRMGISYLINSALSVYGLYDNAFLPQVGIAHTGEALKPLTGTSYEVGIKKDWSDAAWNTTLSFYNIYRNRNLVRDPVSNTIYQTGQNRSSGFEIDARGRIMRGLNIIMNYAYTDSRITKDDKNPEMVGKATPNRVRHIQNTWLNYNLPMAKVKGISVSAGYQLLSGRAERFSSAQPEQLKDIFRVDAGIGYTKNKFGINLIVNNILDTHLYSTAWQRNDMYYWVQLAPRNFRCALTVTL